MSGTELTLGKAINAGLRRAMENDPKVLVMGRTSDGSAGSSASPTACTRTLAQTGSLTPRSQNPASSAPRSACARGYRPVCEIQFDGFFFRRRPDLHPARETAGTLRGRLRLPVVIRIPYGGGIGAVEHHSESPEAYFTHTAGLRVVTVATPVDAYWTIQQAIACDDPVVFLEPKRRYWDKAPVRTDGSVDTATPMGEARIVRPGTDVTLVAYGPMVKVALHAAEADTERSIEVIDLRSLSPVDYDTVYESVRRTGRLVVTHEAPVTSGLGAEIAARVTEACFYHLEAPVIRVGGFDTPYPPSRLEEYYLPDLDRVLDGVDRTFAY